MKLRNSLLPLAVTLLVAGAAAFAQGPGGGRPGGGGMQMSPAAQAKMQAWRKFRDSHPSYRSLTGTIRAISDIDKEPATKVNKVQAKKMLAVVKIYAAKHALKEDEAKAANKKLTDLLTMPQLKAMAAAAAEMQGGRGGFGGGPGGPGGGRGPGGGGFGGPGGGGRGGFDMSKMPDPKEYNPLNVATFPNNPMMQRGKQRVADFVAMLKQRAM